LPGLHEHATIPHSLGGAKATVSQPFAVWRIRRPMSPANSLPFRFQPAWLKSLGVALLATLLASGACARPKPFDVGHLNSIAARSSALISSATGSFDSASPGNLSAAGPFNSVPNIVDAFSLQINSQTFTSALCPASKPACRGWQQFIYSRYQCLGG
jgi:hypothetical protein